MPKDPSTSSLTSPARIEQARIEYWKAHLEPHSKRVVKEIGTMQEIWPFLDQDDRQELEDLQYTEIKIWRKESKDYIKAAGDKVIPEIDSVAGVYAYNKWLKTFSEKHPEWLYQMHGDKKTPLEAVVNPPPSALEQLKGVKRTAPPPPPAKKKQKTPRAKRGEEIPVVPGPAPATPDPPYAELPKDFKDLPLPEEVLLHKFIKRSEVMKVAVLGRGSYGEVFKVKIEGAPVEYAMKVFLGDPKERLKEFIHETKFLYICQGPYVVNFCGWATESTVDGRYTFVTFSELMPAGDLWQACGKTPYTRIQGAEVMAEIARAIEWVHSKRVIHRDVRSPNILLKDRMHPKLNDFGLAITFDEAPKAANFNGGPVHENTPKADIYGMGKIAGQVFATTGGLSPAAARCLDLEQNRPAASELMQPGPWIGVEVPAAKQPAKKQMVMARK